MVDIYANAFQIIHTIYFNFYTLSKHSKPLLLYIYKSTFSNVKAITVPPLTGKVFVFLLLWATFSSSVQVFEILSSRTKPFNLETYHG